MVDPRHEMELAREIVEETLDECERLLADAEAAAAEVRRRGDAEAAVRAEGVVRALTASAEQRIEAARRAQAEADDAAAEAAGALARAQALHEEAAAAHRRADEALERARAEAGDVVEAAQAEAGELVATARAEIAAAQQRAAELIGAAEQQALGVQTEAVALQAELLAELQDEVEARLAQAQHAAERIRQSAIDDAERDAAAIRSAATDAAASTAARAMAASASVARADQPPAGEAAPSPAPSGRRARRRPRWARNLRLLVLLLAVLLAAGAARRYAVAPYSVSAASMEPQLHDGDRIVVNKLAYVIGEPERGDVVILDTGEVPGADESPSTRLVKRVVGLPGEVVRAVGNELYVDGVRLDDPWANRSRTPSFGPARVPDEAVFVLGDNRALSVDSRTFGPVPFDAIGGRVEAVVWPPGHAGRV